MFSRSIKSEFKFLLTNHVAELGRKLRLVENGIYACSSFKFLPVNCIPWPIKTAKPRLFRHYLARQVLVAKIGGHVALLSDPSTYLLYYYFVHESKKSESGLHYEET